jgi:two-component system KDP operon response regulator KdpE
MRTILVVDDERDLVNTCVRLLGRQGWRVVGAGTCAEALSALAADPRPVLVIVDRQLPDGDGLHVMRAALATRTPVIMMTGVGTAATRRRALEEGAAGFLPKPFSTQDLLALVRTIAGDAAGPAGPPSGPPNAEPPRPGIH